MTRKVTSRIVKIAQYSAPLGLGNTQADQYFRDMERKFGKEVAKKIWRDTSI